MVSSKGCKCLLWLSLCVPSWSFLPARSLSRCPVAVRSSAGDFFDEIKDERPENSEPERLSWEELEALPSTWPEAIPRYQRATLVGRVGNDPDPKYFDDGKVVVNLSFAVKAKYHPLERIAYNIKPGEEETDWYGLEIWGRDAEYAAKYVTKGARLGVVGTLKLDKWKDRVTGQRRTAAKIVVQEFEILETKAEAELRKSNKRGPSFYTNDSDDDDSYGGRNPAGTGGFFD